MNKSTTYKNIVLNTIENIKESDKKVFIFGAGRGGWYIMKVLEFYGIEVEAFMDNDADKQQQLYYNYPVNSPKEIAEKYIDSYVFLGVLDKKNIEPVLTQLKSYDFTNIHSYIDAFLFVYFTIVVNRECDKEKFAKSISLLYESSPEKKLYFSPTLSYVITQKCTLKCKNCGAFVSYYKNPQIFSVEKIVEDIHNYCKAFDVVHHIALQGGEPFLHPELKRLCLEVAKIPNLIFIDFVTNGTIVPKDNVIQQFYNSGNCILISDYGKYSTKLKELSGVLENNQIYFDYYKYDEAGWVSHEPIFKRNRNENKNNQIFKKCISGKMLCCQIMNGELHRCSFSNNASCLGLIPRFEKDFVHLDNQTYTEAVMKDKIRSFVFRNNTLRACDYCSVGCSHFVSAGIQV